MGFCLTSADVRDATHAYSAQLASFFSSSWRHGRRDRFREFVKRHFRTHGPVAIRARCPSLGTGRTRSLRLVRSDALILHGDERTVAAAEAIRLRADRFAAAERLGF